MSNQGMRYERRILDIGVSPTEENNEYHRRYYHLKKGQSFQRRRRPNKKCGVIVQ